MNNMSTIEKASTGESVRQNGPSSIAKLLARVRSKPHVESEIEKHVRLYRCWFPGEDS